MMSSAYDVIELRLSDAAAESLENDLDQLHYDGVVAVLWVTSGKTLASFWEGGFHERSDVPTEGIQEIRGIPFVFNQGPFSRKLSGMTLHKDDNGYTVKGN